MTVLIGTSGWSYKHWVGERVFYPDKLSPREHLPFFARHFPTVEINYSYYQLPPHRTFELWQRTAPDGFIFAVKGSRYLTHMRKVREPEEPLHRLMEAATGLGPKLGPLLFQFPRSWTLNLERLSSFLEALKTYPGHRYTFEFRHQTWLVPSVYEVLQASNCALCLPVGWGIPLDVQLTADWTYIRFHGGEREASFSDDELQPWAARLCAWRDQGLDSYSYFNNDTLWHGRPAAIDNARRLRDLVGT